MNHMIHMTLLGSGVNLRIPPKLKASDFHEKRWMSKHSQLKTSRQLQQFSQTKQKQLQFDRAGLDSSRFLAAVKPHGSWFWLRNFLRISLTASFSRSLTHSLVKRPHQQSSPVYRAWLCCSGFCPQLRSVLHLAWWVSRTYPTPLRDKVKQRIVLQTISAPANLQFLKLEQWTHWLYHFHPSLKALPLNYHDTISPYLIKRKSYLHALSIQPACHIPFFRTLGIFKICKILTVQCTPAPGVLVHLGDSRFLDGLDRLDGGFGSLGVPEVYNFIQHKNPQEQSQKF